MDKNRRRFLKILLIGSGVLVIEKILPSFFLRLTNHPAPTSHKKSVTAFKVSRNGKKVSVRDDSGEEVFQIDNGA